MSSANYPPASGTQTPQPPLTRTPGSWAVYDPPPDEWPASIAPYSRTTYQPTAEQLARDELRRRYLRRNVYTPVIIAAIIAIALFAVLFYLAFGVATPQAKSFIAGMSALVVILFAGPVIILMAIMPVSWLAFKLNRRQKRKNFPETGPMAYRSRVQTLLWQLEGLLDNVGDGVDGISARLRRPLVALHARAAYLRGWLNGIRGKFTRSI
jgi:hypothetical protein